MAIHLYHYRDGASDKYWAINDVQTTPGVFEVWYGRKGRPLTNGTKKSDKQWWEVAEEKVRKGYVDRKHLTVGSDNRVTLLNEVSVNIDAEIKQATEIPRLYWAIDAPDDASTQSLIQNELQSICDSFLDDLDEADSRFKQHADNTLAIGDLMDGHYKGEMAYQQGPFGFLLLYVVARSLSRSGFDTHITDSDGLTLPQNPTKAFELFLEVVDEWLSLVKDTAETQEVVTEARNIASRLRNESYFREICVAVKAKEAPLQLKGLDGQRSAFF